MGIGFEMESLREFLLHYEAQKSSITTPLWISRLNPREDKVETFKKIMQISNSLARSSAEINIISIVARFPYFFIMVAGINTLNITSFLLFIYKSVMPYLH